jgi:hypothetical protein
MEIPILYWLKGIIEWFLTVTFFSVFFTLRYFWVFFIVGPTWCIVSCCEPFAFWVSIHPVMSPFRAISLSNNARAMLVEYSLTMETFLLIYCTIWYIRGSPLNLVFSIIFAVSAGLFLLVELCSSLARFTHRVKAMNFERLENPDVLDPAVL